MSPPSMRHRIITVIAATLIALASGTNYVYSAWAPQFAERMKLSSTETNLIGTTGNAGMYLSGILLGYIVDSRGPRLGALIGTVALFAGYFPIHRAYVSGYGSMSVPVLCFFSFLSGMGSCSAFSAAIKTAASNFPHHRGTATAFPLASFGLSAFFFSAVSAMVFRDDTGQFLLVLAVGTSSLVLASSFFLQILPSPSTYSAIADQEGNESEQGLLRQSKSFEHRRSSSSEIGTHEANSSTAIQGPSLSHAQDQSHSTASDTKVNETSLLLPGDGVCGDGVCDYDSDPKSNSVNDSLFADVRGFSMVPTMEFWQRFLLLGLMTGVGLMTINNIGSDVKALWKYYDDSVRSPFLQKRQSMHVSILSMLSFGGRLISGIGSDFLVKKYHLSRFWCLFVSAILFCIGQFAGTQVSNPYHLIIVSAVTGLAYGMLFGVFPSIIAHTFGIAGLSQNWGIMTLAAVLFGNLFNLLYGSIYDDHSIVTENGERECIEGLDCYKSAYTVTFYASVVGALLSLWCIWHDKRVLQRQRMGKETHERTA